MTNTKNWDIINCSQSSLRYFQVGLQIFYEISVLHGLGWMSIDSSTVVSQNSIILLSFLTEKKLRENIKIFYISSPLETEEKIAYSFPVDAHPVWQTAVTIMHFHLSSFIFVTTDFHHKGILCLLLTWSQLPGPQFMFLKLYMSRSTPQNCRTIMFLKRERSYFSDISWAISVMEITILLYFEEDSMMG